MLPPSGANVGTSGFLILTKQSLINIWSSVDNHRSWDVDLDRDHDFTRIYQVDAFKHNKVKTKVFALRW